MVLDPTETAQILELQALLNKIGMTQISQVIDYVLRVALATVKAQPNAAFWNKAKL